MRKPSESLHSYPSTFKTRSLQSSQLIASAGAQQTAASRCMLQSHLMLERQSEREDQSVKGPPGQQDILSGMKEQGLHFSLMASEDIVRIWRWAACRLAHAPCKQQVC